MGDLGLDQLSNDQALNLLDELLLDLANRDPYVINLAQATIVTRAQEFSVRREAVREVCASLLNAYVEQIRKEALTAAQKAIADGSLRLISSLTEGRIAVESDLEAKIKLIDDTMALIQRGEAPIPGVRIPDNPQEPWGHIAKKSFNWKLDLDPNTW